MDHCGSIGGKINLIQPPEVGQKRVEGSNLARAITFLGWKFFIIDGQTSWAVLITVKTEKEQKI